MTLFPDVLTNYVFAFSFSFLKGQECIFHAKVSQFLDMEWIFVRTSWLFQNIGVFFEMLNWSVNIFEVVCIADAFFSGICSVFNIWLYWNYTDYFVILYHKPLAKSLNRPRRRGKATKLEYIYQSCSICFSIVIIYLIVIWCWLFGARFTSPLFIFTSVTIIIYFWGAALHFRALFSSSLWLHLFILLCSSCTSLN